MTLSERDDARHPLGLLEGLATTRAIRRYRRDPIPEADLAAILHYAGRAPSGSNRQPFRFLVLDDDESSRRARRVLGEAFRAGWSAKRSADGYRPSRFAASMDHFVENFEQIPAVILVCLERYRDPDVYEGASVYPACQNLLLAARGLGYGGALTMWHLFVEDDLRQILRIPDHVALSACITLGRPEGGHGPVRRRPVTELIHLGQWGNHPTWEVPSEHRHWGENRDGGDLPGPGDG
jgi:nitroreductase